MARYIVGISILFIIGIVSGNLLAMGNKMNQADLDTPENTEDFVDLIIKANDYLNEQQEICRSKYDLGKYEKWYYDQETGLLTFSDGGVVKLNIKYEEVGSVSKISNTWLWAWANPHVEDKVKNDIIKVREYGHRHKLEKLIKEKWYAEEVDGWEMTAIAAYIMQAKGAYRVPTEKTYSFMIFKHIEDLRNKKESITN